jgi:hypothetical protein
MMAGKETAVVFFNGPSVRQFLDIPRQPLEIGCNFIEQHRDVDHVCAFDQQCVDLIQPQPGVRYWTRSRCRTETWQDVKSGVPYYDSGTLALVVASQVCDGRIYVVGCDWGESNGSIYDRLYTWRRHQPGKQSTEKVRIIQRLAREHELVFVHERHKAQFGADVKWIGPKRFLELC